MPIIPTVIIRIILVTVPLYLVFGISFLTKKAYSLAVVYHLFFITNSILTILYYIDKKIIFKPFLETTIKPEYKTARIMDLFGTTPQAYIIQILSTAIGILIILYLFKKRKIFTI